MKLKRKGIALLWVILTSALILVSIFGISMRVVPQKKMENARAYTQRALAVAESGLADTTYNLRTDTSAPSTNGSVIIKTVLQNLSIGQSYDSGDVAYNSGIAAGDSTYRVYIKKTISGYTFYSLGIVGTASAPVAKQAITVQYSGSFPIGEYGLLSNTLVHVQGGTIQGNVYGTTVEMGNQNGTGKGPTFVQPFAAYAPRQGGSITGVPAGEYNYVLGISVPKLTDITNNRFDTYRGYWSDFLNGTRNYNGDHTAEGYPNTSTKGVRAFFLQYLGVDTYTGSHPAAYQSAFDSFFTHMQTDISVGAISLRPFLEYGKMVYDIQPDSANKPVNLGSKYASAPFLEGTVVIEGDLKLDGGSQIGVNDPNDPARVAHTAVLVTGSVSVAAGQSTINGLLYIDSTDAKALSIKGSGGLAVTGSIVAQGGIELGSDGLSVFYYQNDIYDREIRGALEEGAKFNPVPSSWQQISYDTFLLGQ